ncbi:MAG: plasmid pRiA4b ORF-3 family protein [Bryobacterales bacterium]
MSANTYQLKITLQEIRPAVWRRVQVPGTLSLAGLHYVIQIAFGWTDSHLHEFCVGPRRYGFPDEMDVETEDDSAVTLEEAVGPGINHFRYVYDFGDDWLHDVKVEKVLASDLTRPAVSCLAGRRKCPPEDSGGPWGYTQLLEAIRDPGNPDHRELLGWVGGPFDPEYFDLDAVNRELVELFSKPALGAAV